MNNKIFESLSGPWFIHDWWFKSNKQNVAQIQVKLTEYTCSYSIVTEPLPHKNEGIDQNDDVVGQNGTTLCFVWLWCIANLNMKIVLVALTKQ